MAERIWVHQQLADPELSRTSARKIFFIVVLLQRVKEMLNRSAAQNQLNCRGSRPHSSMIRQEGVVKE